LQKALAQENRAKDVKQFSRFKDNANKEKEDHIINVVDYDNASAREYDLDICVAEWVQESESKPFACSALTPTPVKKKEIKYTFDVSKCDRIFDMLLQEKIIRVRKGHVIPPLEELAIRAYCKWHNSFSHATNGCNVFRRQVQSAISDGRLTFIESSKIKLDTDPFSTNVIDFTNKKMLIRSDQTRSAKGKNVIIDDNAHPRMIKQKSAEAGLWKINERNRQSAPIPKRTIKKLLDKYTLCKANKVFSRFGGTKCPSYPSGTGGRDPAGYFQAEFVSSEHMYRRPLHEKRAQFNNEVGLHDAILFHGNNEKPISRASNPRRRQSVGGKYHGGGQKFKWVAINRESRVESRDGTEHGYTKSTAVEDTSLNADLEPVVQTHSAKAVVPANTSESADASAGLYPGGTVKVGAGGTDAYGLIISEYSSTEGVVSNPKTIFFPIKGALLLKSFKHYTQPLHS
jgi:hypothetical protein